MGRGMRRGDEASGSCLQVESSRWAVLTSTQWVGPASQRRGLWLPAQPERSPELVFNKPPRREWESSLGCSKVV